MIGALFPFEVTATLLRHFSNIVKPIHAADGDKGSSLRQETVFDLFHFLHPEQQQRATKDFAPVGGWQGKIMLSRRHNLIVALALGSFLSAPPHPK